MSSVRALSQLAAHRSDAKAGSTTTPPRLHLADERTERKTP